MLPVSKIDLAWIEKNLGLHNIRGKPARSFGLDAQLSFLSRLSWL
jgi:hypothetical protein